jgi:hypothetical protein
VIPLTTVAVTARMEIEVGIADLALLPVADIPLHKVDAAELRLFQNSIADVMEEEMEVTATAEMEEEEAVEWVTIIPSHKSLRELPMVQWSLPSSLKSKSSLYQNGTEITIPPLTTSGKSANSRLSWDGYRARWDFGYRPA